jgi:glycosyltransferase involved in cell wall biosynthesis
VRIAYVNSQPVPDALPSTLQVLQFADALAAIGHDVHLVTPAPAVGNPDARALLGRAPAPRLAFEATRDHRRRWYFPSSSNRPFHAAARRWLAAHPVDAIYVRNLKLAEALLAGDCRAPLFFETHELFAQSFREHNAEGFTKRRKLRLLEAREGAVYRRVAGLVPITAALLDDIRTAYRVATPALVAADGVDLALADAALALPAAENAEPVILYLGSLHRWKGVETLLDAVRHSARGVLWIAGGSDERIAELAATTGNDARIRFLGAIAPAERFSVIARADICVLPLANTSIGARYTSPLKLFEYMAMGKAIVASDLPSIREVLTDGVNGALVPAENAVALAAALDSLAGDHERRRALGQAARATALRYTWIERARAVSQWITERLQ